MKKIWPTFHYISRSIVTKSSFAFVIVIFILYVVGIRFIHATVLPRNSLQATFGTFQMFGNSFLTLLSMICVLLPFLIIFSQTFQRAISSGGYMVWIRLKSIARWIVCLLTSIIVFTIVFLALGYFLAYCVHYLLPTQTSGYEVYFKGSILKQFGLLAGSMVIIVFINITLIIVFKNTAIALLISLSIVLVSSVVFTTLSVPAIYFPFLYGFYSNEVNIFTALIVLIVVMAFLFYFIFVLFQRKFESLHLID